ncbi:MAG: hypothetical protein ACM31C_32915 [Acidobacteriota bacterium]
MAVAAVLGACASGQQLAPGDGQGGGPLDAPDSRGPDAAVVHDGPQDAKLPPDAHVYNDAHVYMDAHEYLDAHVYMDAAVCTPQTTELLANPTVDLTPVGTSWNQTPIDSSYPDITSDGTLAPQSNPYKMWMGGFAGTDKGVSSVTDVVYQDIAVPAGTTQLVLTGYYVVATSESPNDYPYDTSTVELVQTNGTPIETALSLNNQTSAGAWTSFSHTFTANVSGQTVRLRLTSTNDITNATSFYFDTFALSATHCP